MPQPNYAFARRKKEMKKKQKQEEKRLRKLARKATQAGEVPDQSVAAEEGTEEIVAADETPAAQ